MQIMQFTHCIECVDISLSASVDLTYKRTVVTGMDVNVACAMSGETEASSS